MAPGLTGLFDVGYAETQGDRDQQEDFFQVADPRGSGKPYRELDEIVVALADGVGGEAAGDIASRTVVTAFCNTIQSFFRQSGNSVPHLLEKALMESNRAVFSVIEGYPSKYQGMASTLVGALVLPGFMHWISVGDSHLYLLRKNKITKLNQDHSLGAVFDRQAREGKISFEQAAGFANRNVLLSFVAGEPIEQVDLQIQPYPLHRGDRLLFASDGINALGETSFILLSHRHTSASEFAKALIAEVLEARQPGQDNTVVVVIDKLTSEGVVYKEPPTRPV